jgi:hypothetical protein
MKVNDSMMPSKEVAGRDLKDAGHCTGLSDTYGASSDAFSSGVNGRTSISGSTKSDKGGVNNG